MPTWEEFLRAWDSGRLAHALLVEGPEGLGKVQLAFAIAARVLGKPWEPTEPVAPPQHADLATVTLEMGERGLKKQIGIQQVRDACAELALTSYSGGWKAAVFWPADRLTLAAANGLLKTLEEPPARTLLVLVRSRLDTLPATIASRCQRLRVQPPPSPDALAWLRAQDAGRSWDRLLELAGGAPLLALRFAQDGIDTLDAGFTTDLLGILGRRREPLEVAANWQRSELAAVLRWLYAWTASMIRLKSAGAPPVLPRSELEALQTAAEGIPLQRLFRYLDEVGAAATRLDGALNAQLVIESLLAPWADGLEPVVANATQGYLADR